MIWGITLKPGEVWTKTVDCEEYLTLASLDCRQRKNNGELNPSASLIVLIKGEEHLLCTLEKGSVLQQKLDLQLTEAVTFMVEGTGIVYITGYSTVQSPQPYHESPSICHNDSTAEDSQRQGNNKLLKEQPVTSVKNEQTGDANNNSWNEYYKNFIQTHEVGKKRTVTTSQGVSSSDGNILTVKIPRVKVTRLKQGSWDSSGTRVNNEGHFDPLIPPEENSVTEKDSNPREQMDVSGGDLLGADEDLQMSMTTASLPPNDEDKMWILASSDEDKTTSAPQVGDIGDMSPMVSQYQWQSDDGWCAEEPSMNDNEFTDVNSPLATGVAADSSDKEDEDNRADSLEEMSSEAKGLRELESVRADAEPLKLITQDQSGEQEYGRTSYEKHNTSESDPLKTELQLLTTVSSGCHGNLGDSTDNQSDSTTVKDDNNFIDKAPIIDTDSTPQGALKSMPEELAKDSMDVSSSFQKNITRGRPTGKSRKTLAVQRENANKKECPNAEDTLPTRKPFPCQQCVENFVDEDLLADHERTHSIDLAAKMNHGDSSQKPLGHSDQNQNLVSCPQMHAKTKHNCGYCDRVYKYYNDLQKHERSHRAEVKQDKFWCRLCHSTFKTRGSFLNHTKVHTTNRRKGKQKSSAKKKKYRCSFCGKLLYVKRDWIKHERTHTGEKPFNCRICDKAFSMARDARYHETKVHARQLASTSRNETSTVCDNLTVPSSAVATETSGRSASGSSASSGTDTAELLDSTLSSNSEKDKMPSLTADKTKSSSISQNTPKESQLKNKHTCCFCPSSFATKQRLWSHIEYHRVAHSHKCSYCPRLCAYESARKIHERSHTGERPFKCKLCTKSFIRKSHLNRHLKRVPHPEAD